MNRWRSKLDANLPGDLRQIAEWINRAEEILARGINFDPLKLPPEENVQRFTRLYEEHAVWNNRFFAKKDFPFFFFVQMIFTDKEVTSTRFQRLQRDSSITQQVAKEHLTDLDERLKIIMSTSEERGRYLDFEQIHWKVQIYFVQLLNLKALLNKRQGDRNQTEQLFNVYKVGINQTKYS
jgi:hypothetical protein